MGGGSGSKGTAINSVKNAKMKRVEQGGEEYNWWTEKVSKKKVVNILSYDKVGRQMGNIGGPKGRGV